MRDIKFLNTAFAIKKDSKTGGNGTITYMDLEMSPTSDKVETWGITEAGEIPQELRLVTRSKFFELQRFQVKSTYPSELISDINYFHGIDGGSMIDEALNNEMDQYLVKNLYKKYSEIGEITRVSQYTKWQKFILKIFPKMIFSNYVKEDRNGSEMLYNKIVVEANKIASRTRIKPGDFIVCSSLVGSLLQDHPGFSYESLNNSISLKTSTIDYIGSIAGRIAVYVNANQKFNDGWVIIGRKTNTHEAGVYFIYEDREKIQLADIDPSKNNFSIIQRVAIVDTNGAEKSFSKIHFTVGKKPFWKKLFNI